MLKHTLFLLVLFSFPVPVSPSGGHLTPQSQDSVPLAELIKKAALRRNEYIEMFKHLLAEETQKVEEYGSDGRLKRQRVIISDFIVYESQVNNSSTAEYRNVRIVDAKPVDKRDRRGEQLFLRLAKAESEKKELERVARESRRYDLNYSFYGMTLNQSLPLDERLSPSFRFIITGSERIDGHDVVVVEYEQVAQSPDIASKLSLPGKLKGAEPLFRGRLWLERETAKLRREERELILKHPSLPAPLLFMKFEFGYGGSRFDILTPKRIVISTYNRGRDRADGSPELLLGGTVSFEYGGFRRFQVDSSEPQLDAQGNN